MAKVKKAHKFRLLKHQLIPVLLSLILFFLIIYSYQVITADKFYPLTYVGDTNISLLTKGQAIRKLQNNFQNRSQQKLNFNSNQSSFTIDLATSSASLNYDELDKTFNNTHNGSIIFFRIFNINPKISLTLDKQLDKIADAVEKKPQNAKLIFDETINPEGTPSSRIQITEGSNGQSLDKEKTIEQISNFLLTGKYQADLPLKTIFPKVSTEHVMKAKAALEQLQNNPIKLNFEQSAWTIDIKQLLTLLNLETDKSDLLDKDKTNLFLNKISSEIDQPVAEGLFEFNPATKRVSAFRPSQEGRKMDQEKTFQLISDSLTNGSSKNITIPVEIIKPKIQTGDVNNLGIKEMIGQGVSNFAGSIANRIYNIGLTASKLNGILVSPGQTFSFNQTVGDISAATGYKQAYVIKEGRTVLDDGGGVCQDSTTLFRAVLNAGLPVVARTAHAYRVGYYEQGFPPGLDATVYYPSVDFQFKNDTPAHILIQAFTVGNSLYINLYGTSDNRIVDLTRPIVTDKTPPPPDLRQDDPTLPKGTVKQVDWAAWGANVSFKRTVIRNGETIINETWRSNFKPWQAVFLVGTG